MKLNSFKSLLIIIVFVLFGSKLTFAISLSGESLNMWRGSGGFVEDIKYADKKPSAKILKEYLIGNGENIKIVNNVFGVEVMGALNNFRIKNSLIPSPVFDYSTRDYINKNLINELCPTRINVDNNFLFPISKLVGVPADFAPANLVLLDKFVTHSSALNCVTKETSDALTKMEIDANIAGIYFGVTSSFRRYEIQDYLYHLYEKTNPIHFKSVIAPPSHSEHQLGTTVDLAVASQRYAGTNDNLANTKEGIWLANNAYKYGFVMSYPKGGEIITGYKHEPWHYRYVGVDVAKSVRDSGKTLYEVLTELEKSKNLSK